MDAPTVPEALPTLFAGKFRLGRRLGAGGMGEVFLAVQESIAGFEKRVALKLRRADSTDEKHAEMFLYEARLSARLLHPNIAQIYDLGLQGETYFIAMEYLPARDLRDVMHALHERGEPFPVDLACWIVARLCEALDYAHRLTDEQGRPLQIVHRDVSPSNVLLGFNGEVKLIDFGIAKAADRQAHTAPGLLRGKIGYLSPEVISGREADRRSDVFAVGAVLYQLLTGQPAFGGTDDQDVLIRARDGKFPAPRVVNPAVPPELEAIVLQAMRLEPDSRYPSGAALRDELERWLRTRPSPVDAAVLSGFLRELLTDEVVEAELSGLTEAAASARRPTQRVPVQEGSSTTLRTPPAVRQTVEMGPVRSDSTQPIPALPRDTDPSPAPTSGSARWLILAAVGFAVAGVAAVAAVWMPSRAAEPVIVPPRPVSPPAPVVVVPPAEPEPVDPPVADEVKPATPPRPRAAPAVYSWANVVFEASGSAQVVLDGKVIGVVPRTEKVPAGAHTVRFDCKGKPGKVMKYTFAANRDTVVSFKCPP